MKLLQTVWFFVTIVCWSGETVAHTVGVLEHPSIEIDIVVTCAHTQVGVYPGECLVQCLATFTGNGVNEFAP